MTIYHSHNFAEDWNMVSSRQTVAGDDETKGNLSFRKNTSKDKERISSTRGVERYGLLMK